MKKRLALILVIALFIVLLSRCIFYPASTGRTRSDDSAEASKQTAAEAGGVSKESAQSTGGIYILRSDGYYYSLQHAASVGNDYSNDNLVVTAANHENIPTLSRDDKLVFFSENTLPELHCYPVLKSGYTIPISFGLYYNYNYAYDKDDQHEVYVTNFGGTFEPVDSVLISEVNRLYNCGFPENNQEIEIVGEDFKTFFETYVFDACEYCANGACWGSDYIFADLPQNKEISISWYVGTQYNECDLTANIHYFVFDGCDNGGRHSVDPIELQLTQDGYAILDTDSLSSGQYILHQKIPLFDEYYSFVFEIA